MSLVLTEEQELLKETATEFLKAHAPVTHLRALRDGKDAVGFSRKLWKEMAELGWVGILFDESVGGAETRLRRDGRRARGVRPHARAVPVHGDGTTRRTSDRARRHG